jgi:hypothetical protein
MTELAPIASILDTINALICIIEEESETLALTGYTQSTQGNIAELALAKARLAGRLEHLTVQLQRENPYWMKTLPDEMRADMTAAYRDLHNASVVNADILERQIDLSSDMLAAVGHEIERLTGHGSTTYSARGKVRRSKSRPPLSINTRL